MRRSFRGAGPVPVDVKHRRPAGLSGGLRCSPRPWAGGARVLSLGLSARWMAGPLALPLGPLGSQVHRLDIAPREEADAPAETASPPAGVKALQDLNDVTAAEAELGGVLG